MYKYLSLLILLRLKSFLRVNEVRGWGKWWCKMVVVDGVLVHPEREGQV